MSRQDRPLFAGSARSGSPELTLINVGIATFCGLGLISSLGPAGAWFADYVFATLAVVTALALAVAAARRELRIRRRLAAIKPLTPDEVARRRSQITDATNRGRAA
jgi:hypothetical protein